MPTGNELFEKHGLAVFPGIRKPRVTTKELQTMLLELAFPILLNGRSYDLTNKRIGPGVYEVWLTQRYHDVDPR